jgi:hypothetical protein
VIAKKVPKNMLHKRGVNAHYIGPIFGLLKNLMQSVCHSNDHI